MENKPFGKVKEVIGDNPDGTTTVKVQVTPLVDPIDIDIEREVIAVYVENATDAHDLHEIAARIRARKGMA